MTIRLGTIEKVSPEDRQKRLYEQAAQEKLLADSIKLFIEAGKSGAAKPAYPDDANWIVKMELDQAYEQWRKSA